MQIGVLEPIEFSIEAVKLLSKIGEVHFYKDEKLEDFLKNKNVLFIRLSYQINYSFLCLAPNLKFLCTPTTGLNHIDEKLCKSRGINLISLKNEIKFLKSIRATPEHTFGLVLSLLRNYKSSFLSSLKRDWNRDLYKGHEIFENKVGIVGYGRVGTLLSKYFKAFGAKVFYYDIDDTIVGKFEAIKSESVEDLINNSNIIIISISYTELNRDFINKNLIDLLKGKYLINTSRGEIIDEDYLIEKIKKNFFKGVALDVIKNENSTKNNLSELLKLTNTNNLIITPHVSGATYSSMKRTEEFITMQLLKKFSWT